MKLAILSNEPKNYSTRRLVEAAKLRGHDVKVLNTLKFALDLEEESPDLYYRQKRLNHYDAILPQSHSYLKNFGRMILPLRILAMHRRFCNWQLSQPNNSSFLPTAERKLAQIGKQG